MRIILYLLICLTFVNCRPEPLVIDLPEYEEKMVVSSQIIPSSTMLVGLSKSFTILSQPGADREIDSSFFTGLLIDSALVTIQYGGFLDTLFKVGPGAYGSLDIPQQINTTYNLRVKNLITQEIITASSTMLPQVAFDTVYPIINNTLENPVKIKYSFSDLPGTDNYYMVNIFSENQVTEGLDVNSFFERGSNQLLVNKLYDDYEYSTSLIEDEVLLEQVSTSDSIVVTLSNISKQYYGYLLQRRRVDNNLLNQITNEPINFNTNIEGGLGFFNTHNPDVVPFDLNDFE